MNISCQRLHECGTALLVLLRDIPPITAALLVKTNRRFQHCLHSTSRSYFGFSPEQRTKVVGKVAATLSLKNRTI